LIKHLEATRIIVPRGEEHYFNPYGKNWKYYRDMATFEMVTYEVGADEDSEIDLKVIDRYNTVDFFDWI
jgi:hypothetical protein